MQSYRNPLAAWVPAAIGNYTPDREGHHTSPPFYVVFHTTVGSRVAAIARFQNPAAKVSAHYIVGLDGSITQLVDEKDAAYHAGVYAINLDSIGIEHVDDGNYNGPRTPALYAASVKLFADICRRYKFDPKTVARRHRDFIATGCPDSLDVERIVNATALALAPAPPAVPEWKANLKANAQTFQLTTAVALLDMETGAKVQDVQPGTLAVAYETSVKGNAYWMTAYSVQTGKPHGLKKSDVAAAVASPLPPADTRDQKIVDLNVQVASLEREIADRDSRIAAAKTALG